MILMEETMLDIFRAVGKLSDVEYEAFKDILTKKKPNSTCNCKCFSGAGASA
jgi:energy-converting hydrogenase A subunit M